MSVTWSGVVDRSTRTRDRGAHGLPSSYHFDNARSRRGVKQNNYQLWKLGVT
jgi:hypothetical protein